MLDGITITCFAGSYLVSLAAEVSRIYLRTRWRTFLNIGMTAAGLLAHTLYLISLAQRESTAVPGALPLSSWYDWCLIAAWVLAAAYFGLSLRHSENAVGLFLLPLVLGLVTLATFCRDANPFPREQALTAWRLIHGLSLMLGTVGVTLGFAGGVMYLVQSFRLKRKLPIERGFRLPSLEWLQRFSSRSLVISTCLVALGFMAGLVLNGSGGSISWSDPVIWSSAILFAWLVVANIFEWAYKPARQGRKVAYLTLASFLFLALAVTLALWGRHASGPDRKDSVSNLAASLPRGDA